MRYNPPDTRVIVQRARARATVEGRDFCERLSRGYPASSAAISPNTCLRETDWQVAGTVYGRSDNITHLRNRLALYPAELSRIEVVRLIIEETRPDYIFHLAAQPIPALSKRDPWFTLENNIRAQLNVLEALRETGLASRVLVVGSSEEYGQVQPGRFAPQRGRAAASRHTVCGEQGLAGLPRPAISDRLWHGSDSRAALQSHRARASAKGFVAPDFASQIAEIEAGLRPPEVMVGALDVERDFSDVRDIVRGYHLAMLHGKPGDVYNLGADHAHSIREMLDTLIGFTGMEIRVVQDPARMRGADTPSIVSDCSKLRALTGWRTEIPFEDSLRDVLDYWREQVRLDADRPHAARNAPRTTHRAVVRLARSPRGTFCAATGHQNEESMPKALITGITGQDGSYLAEFLLDQGYEVLGMVRRTSTVNFDRIRHFQDRVTIVQGDLLDQVSLIHILQEHRPDEVYNLAAQSFVPTSFTQPVLTGEFTALGVTRVLDAIRTVDRGIRFYQASSSEMFGKVHETPQRETTPFHPRSPYGVAKVYGHWITINYRESYDLFACSGILFNHESPRRGLEFVTHKITQTVARIKLGLTDELRLGNLEARRDWGYAPDYVRAMWLMLQHDQPDDYVVATGETHSVREFCQEAFDYVGMDWEKYVVVDPRFYRPAEVDLLVGDASKAGRILHWEPSVTFNELVRIMVDADLEQLAQSGNHTPQVG